MAEETTEKRIEEILKNQNKALLDQIEKEKELRALRGESLDRISQQREALQKQITLEGERLKNQFEFLRLADELKEKRVDALKVQLEDLETKKKILKDAGHSTNELDKQIELGKKQVEETEDLLKLHKDGLLKTFVEQTAEKVRQQKLNDKALEASQNLGEATKDLLGSITGVSDAWKTGNSFSERMLQSIVASRAAGGSLTDQISAMAGKFKETFTLQNFGASLLLKSISATKDLMFEMDNSLASFKRATGLNGEYTESVVDVQQEMAALGASTADITKSFTDLSAANSTFVFENEGTRKALMKTAAAMEQGLNAGQEFADSMGFLQSTLGKTAEAAQQSALDIASAAQAMSIPPSQLLDDFAKLGPALAHWGPNTEKVFLETAAAAKALNMQTSEMLSIAEGFDTFASAADKVGQLNAALGGDYFDTMEMVMATEEDRIELLMSGIEASGKSFETMGRFEQKRIAEAAGVTVEQLGKMTGANKELYEELQQLQKDSTMTYNDLSAAARANMGIQEKLAALQKALAQSLEPVIDGLNSLLGYVQEFSLAYPGWFKIIAWGGGIIAFFSGLVLMAGPPLLSMAGSLGLVGTASAAAGTAVAAAGFSVAGFVGVVGAMAQSLKTAAPGLLALGGAALMIGGGIWLAADGMANLVSSFIELGDKPAAASTAITAVAIVMGGMILVVFGLALAVGALGAAGTAGAIGLGVLGLTVLAIGYGVKLAADGMANLVSSFATLGESLAGIDASLTSVAMVMGGMILVVLGLALAVGALGAAGTAGAIGLLAIGAAAMMVGFGVKLAAEGMAKLVGSFSSLSDQGLEAIDTFAGVAGSVGMLSLALGSLGPATLLAVLALAALSAVDLSMTSDIEATRVVKDTIVAATAVTPAAAANVEAMSDQIIRMHAETADAGTNTVLKTIKEVLVGSSPITPAGQTTGPRSTQPSGQPPINVVLEVDGRQLAKVLMPAVEKRFKPSVVTR